MTEQSSKPYLSKSKLIAAWQCPKKLHLEIHQPELAKISAKTESLFVTGHQVGAIAQDIYGSPEAVEIPYVENLSVALRETEELIKRGAKFPIFEATFQHGGVLVRVDVLIPVGNGWRAIEVKASTKVKEHYKVDCAIQYWVMRNEGMKIKSISLAHINNEFVYQGDGNYGGLLVEVDLTEDVLELESQVSALIADARTAAGNDMPVVKVGGHCNKPYDCQFQAYCWPTDAEYPVMGLGGGKTKLGAWVNVGCRDIRDVDRESITNADQQRIHRVTCTGKPEVLEGWRTEIDALAYPRYYLDFETISPAVPFWPGTRPYKAVAIQWSCHIEDGPTDDSSESLRQEKFLDLSGDPPMRPLAEHMIECLGESGPILMYTKYEKTVIMELMALFPDLADPLSKLIDRLVDLHPIVKNHYYHPKMLGSWSIKSVIPTMFPHMSYSELEGISEGIAASDGYLEAIDPNTTAKRKAKLEEQLLRYCKFDTEAMVEIVRFFTAEKH